MMSDEKKTVAELDALFNPESIAVVGVPKGMKSGKLFLIALLDMGFKGKIYPVNPHADEIDGIKAYPSVSDIPGPVDLAIVLVPQQAVLSVVKECADKGVKGAVLFTAGGRELGTDEGRLLEEQLVTAARSSGMRLFGPNCMGLYAPVSGLSFFPGMPKEPGNVGLISHSGSLANIFGRSVAPELGITFSKAVSLGNESDLNSADFFGYLGEDPDTELIGAYIEGIKDGPRLAASLKSASLNKPVVIWKMGLTPEGGKAASSHTGALAGTRDVWLGLAGQCGVVSVETWEEWTDCMMALSKWPAVSGDRIAIISGPGGLAVSAAEACGREGLKLAELSDETMRRLSEFVPPTGTSVKNPVDVGLNASFDMDMNIKAAELLVQDDGVDAVLIMAIGFGRELNEKFTDSTIEMARRTNKPFIIVNIPGFDSDLARKFCEKDVPYFQTSERALSTYARALAYQKWRARRNDEG